MLSPSQLQANRANALKSTGPRSSEGKTVSARNALKHGLRSREIVLMGVESAPDFEAFRESFYRRFAPVDPVELSLVDRIAAAEWRLRRVRRIETATFVDTLRDAGVHEILDDPEHAEGPESYEVESQILHDAFGQATCRLDRLYHYEAQLERSIERSIRQLERLRTSGVLGANEADPPEPPTEPVSVAAVSSTNSSEQSQSAVAAGRQPASSSPRLALLRPNRPERDRIGGVRIPAGSTFSNG